MTQTEQKLQELEMKKAELAKMEKQILEEANYYKNIEHRDNWVKDVTVECSIQMSRLSTLFKLLSSDAIVKQHITFEKQSHELNYSNYYQDKLKEEDKQPILKLDKGIIKTKWGNIYDCSFDFKAELPSALSNRYQSYKPESIIKKIKEAIVRETNEQNEKNKLNVVSKKLTETFQKQYPDATIESKQAWVSGGYGRNSRGHYIDILEIKFPNTSWVKIIYYSDGSWGIHEKFKANVTRLTKEEVIADLAR
jgi:hypothetical protein